MNFLSNISPLFVMHTIAALMSMSFWYSSSSFFFAISFSSCLAISFSMATTSLKISLKRVHNLIAKHTAWWLRNEHFRLWRFVIPESWWNCQIIWGSSQTFESEHNVKTKICRYEKAIKLMMVGLVRYSMVR